MTDPDLVAKKLAQIETYLRQLRDEADLSRLRTETKEERFVAHTLQLAVQAALDVASHIVADRRLGEPRTNRELFTLLERDDWIESELADTLRDMAGFRNVLVHGYEEVDLDVVEDIVENHLTDLEEFVENIRRRM
jgi:uncharacterized protein YutE (UPF0331/DUF86 family)